MADKITMQVTRYRPEEESSATVQEYEVPCPKDWVVLDGLNYIKDRLDGSLSYRWSCRMGVCGSCGMTVNGEPKLTCETFLSEYGGGPVRVEPLRNFPVVRDLVVEIGDFMRKLVAVKPWIIRDQEKPKMNMMSIQGVRMAPTPALAKRSGSGMMSPERQMPPHV